MFQSLSTTLFLTSSQSNLEFSSHRLTELWFAPSRYSKSLFELEDFQGHFPCLEQATTKKHALLGGEELILPVASLLQEVKKLLFFLEKGTHTQRFFFAPQELYSRFYQCLPTSSQRKLKTVQVFAGIDTCLGNRNWDGLDRFEDLTALSCFDHDYEELFICQMSLRSFFSSELRRLLRVFSNTQQKDEFVLSFFRDVEELHFSSSSIPQLAERFRRRAGIADYRLQSLQLVESWLEKLNEKQRQNETLFEEVPAFVGEILRANWGGYYQQNEEGLLWKHPSGRQSKLTFLLTTALKKAAIPKLVLHGKVLHSFFAQGEVIRQLTSFAQSRRQEIRSVAIRILTSLQDIRIDKFFVQHLFWEEEKSCLMRILAFLLHSPLRIKEELLLHLGRNVSDGVAGRAWLLLAKQKSKALPDLLWDECQENRRISLRPLARHVLEELGTKDAKQMIKKLGTIPLLPKGAALMKENPQPIAPLELLPDVLENSINPTKLKQMLDLFLLFPQDSERAVFGAALADPEEQVKAKAISILASSQHKMAKELLASRVLFEEHPLSKKMLLDAISTQKERAIRKVGSVQG